MSKLYDNWEIISYQAKPKEHSIMPHNGSSVYYADFSDLPDGYYMTIAYGQTPDKERIRYAISNAVQNGTKLRFYFPETILGTVQKIFRETLDEQNIVLYPIKNDPPKDLAKTIQINDRIGYIQKVESTFSQYHILEGDTIMPLNEKSKTILQDLLWTDIINQRVLLSLATHETLTIQEIEQKFTTTGSISSILKQLARHQLILSGNEVALQPEARDIVVKLLEKDFGYKPPAMRNRLDELKGKTFVDEAVRIFTKINEGDAKEDAPQAVAKGMHQYLFANSKISLMTLEDRPSRDQTLLGSHAIVKAQRKSEKYIAFLVAPSFPNNLVNYADEIDTEIYLVDNIGLIYMRHFLDNQDLPKQAYKRIEVQLANTGTGLLDVAQFLSLLSSK